MQALGDRMKRYELASQAYLTPRTPVIIRVDGRAFHTFTKGLQRPFDFSLAGLFHTAMQNTAGELKQNFKLAYHQSDEVSFLLTDWDSLESDCWFDYNLQKLASLTASIFSVEFAGTRFQGGRQAYFDARAFNVPLDDVANYFLWRAKDWQRNALHMVARAHFSHGQLQGANQRTQIELLEGVGVNWEQVAGELKFGTYYSQAGFARDVPPNYEAVNRFVQSSIRGEALNAVAEVA